MPGNNLYCPHLQLTVYSVIAIRECHNSVGEAHKSVRIVRKISAGQNFQKNSCPVALSAKGDSLILRRDFLPLAAELTAWKQAGNESVTRLCLI
jgi:hypothetical protein